MSTENLCPLLTIFQESVREVERARLKAIEAESEVALDIIAGVQLSFAGLSPFVHQAAKMIEAQEKLCTAMRERIDELTADNVKLHAVADDIIRLWQQRGQQPPDVKTE